MAAFDEPAQAENWRTWYEKFDENYSPETRRTWYSEAAQAYRQARPRYPDAMVDDVIRTAGLAANSSVFEIGCGPGIATEAFAKRGLVMQSVEPSPAACELARVACQAYPQVTVTNSTFEDFPLAGQTFDAVLAATSFHWVSPEVACKKSAEALRPGGSLILLWATPPQPGVEVCDRIQPIYEQFGLADKIRYQLRDHAYYKANFDEFAKTIGDSGFFGHTAVEILSYQSHYSVEKYIALLSTLSDYIALPSTVRSDLFQALSDNLQDCVGDKGLAMTHWFGSQVSPVVK
ncbi:MAG: class I SAM-dependent methyltransferase [Cyanobacteria bacterium J06643_4]